MHPTTAIEYALTQLLRAAFWWITIIMVSTQRWHRLAKHRELQPLAARRNQLLAMVGRETFMLVFLLKHLQGNRLGLGLGRKQLVLVAHTPLRIFTSKQSSFPCDTVAPVSKNSLSRGLSSRQYGRIYFVCVYYIMYIQGYHGNFGIICGLENISKLFLF